MLRWIVVPLISSMLWYACQNNSKDTDLIGFFDGVKAQWITDARKLPEVDSLFYLDYPAAHFRKTFEATNQIKQAKMLVTSAGYYLATINGKRIGENVLDPAWTDYSKRIYYSEYDVTSLLQEGTNSLGVILGNGFYNPLPLRKWGRRNLREDMVVGKPAYLLKLIIVYHDGSMEEIVSDSSWKYAYGPILKNSVYIGVDYDARKELTGWDQPGYNDTDWEDAVDHPGPGGKLEKSFFPPVQITQKIKPVSIYTLDAERYIVDMGVNFTGAYRIKIKGHPGDTLSFRFGERIYKDGTLNPMTSVIGQIKRKGVGGPGAPDTAWQTDHYVLGNAEPVWFQPEFTYHTYRYMEIRGLDYRPEIEDIQGLFLHTKVNHPNHFSCSSELLNDIQEAVELTFLANLISVQSDCPAREKFGYGGDINATSESFIYNFDMLEFYRKTVYDWLDAMKDSSFVDTAPFVGIEYCGISWESAYLITQYYMYLYYNDLAIVEELYEKNKEWMEKVARIHPEGLVDQGLSDHESLQPVPVELTGTCHYLQCARIMATFARVMNDPAHEEKYTQLAEYLKDLIKAKFWDQPVTGDTNRQTLFATLLYHGIIPAGDLKVAKDSLMKAVRNGPNGHFNTGIFGTKYALEMLSKYVSPQAVFDIVNSTDYPGWGHMIDRGATTIWETWKESDDVYSNCHPMFGSVTEWYFRWLGGIRPDPQHPGFSRFDLEPYIPQGLDSVSCSYQTPRGPIVSNWSRELTGNRRYEFSVPGGSMARVRLPLKPSQKIEIRQKTKLIKEVDIHGMESGQFNLTAGDYLIKVTDQ